MRKLRRELDSAAIPDGPTGRATLIRFATRFCEVLQTEGRDADEWESALIVATVGAVRGGLTRYAATCLKKAMTDPALCAPGTRGQGGTSRGELEQMIAAMR
ncbi:MAG: hypothetical protein JO224_00850 [Pelomonas sp.]|nr:hypothetical protein [Roseateles sp.]